LLQRFQELEGEIRLGAESLPVWGQVRGSSVVVETTRDHPQLGGLRLVGEISGDRLHGEDFQALRRPADVAGVWDVESVDDPYEAPWSLRLARSAGGWTATRRGPDTASIERPMGDLYVLGSSVSFVVGGDDGSARRVVYHGLVEGDRIDGMIHDRGALIPWTAIRRGATADRPVRCP
jgi:hypothetical protein